MTTPNVPETGSGTDEAAKRRPYRKPRLRHLGSVRELTLGKSGRFPDGVGMFMKGKKF